MTNEVLKNIITRRSVKKYRPEQIKAEELDAVLEAGLYAPSGMGAQSPVMVAVQDRETMDQIVRMNAAVMGTDANPYYDAPTVILVFGPSDRRTFVEDASCVLENMMLAAHSIGLGSRWIHREKDMKKWGVPEGHTGVGALSLGYPDGEPKEAAPRREGRIIYVK